MNNFWSLVGFEFKKIFVRKSVFAAIALGIAATVLSVAAMVIGADPDTNKSYYEDMLIDKEYMLAFSGRPLDGDLIMETSKAYQKVPTNVYPYNKTEEYNTYARPYHEIYTLIDSAYAERSGGLDLSGIQTISKETADGYYEKRIKQYRLNLENNPTYTQEEADRVIKLDDQVEKPFIMEYTDGYKRFFSSTTVNAFILMFIIAFILSPIFVNEYSQNTDSLILTSKNGKSSQIYAKIFTGLSVSVLLTTVFLTMGYLLCMLIYGFDGANSPIQLHVPLLTYDFTMIEAAGLISATTILGGFLMTGICLYLSSAISKSILVLAINIMVILAGMFNGIYSSSVEIIRYFLPSPMATYSDMMYHQHSWNIFGVDIWLYQAVCIVAIIVGSLLLLLTYRNFKYRQAG